MVIGRSNVHPHALKLPKSLFFADRFGRHVQGTKVLNFRFRDVIKVSDVPVREWQAAECRGGVSRVSALTGHHGHSIATVDIE